MQRTAHEVYSFDEFRLDLTRGCLFRGDVELKLRPQSFDVLKYLTENSGRLVSKDELIDHVWQGMAVTDDSLVQCLKDIRHALGDDTQQIIKTVPRRGYIFDKEVRENGSALYVEETSGVHLVIEESEETNGYGATGSGAPLPVAGRRSLIGAAKRHKWVTALGLTVVIVAVSGIAYGVLAFLRRPPAPPFRSVTVKRLTTDGKATLAAISPNGNFVTYAISENDLQSIWLRQVAAVNPTQIVAPAAAEYTALTFSPDGNSIFFVREKTLYQVPTLGGVSPRKLWDGIIGGLTFSPDGKRVAFTRHGEQQATQLVTANRDGAGEPRVLAVRNMPEFFTWGNENGCAWSPDGETIVCVGGENGGFGRMLPIAVHVADGRQTPLTDKRWNYTRQVAWLADGSGILMNANDLFEVNSQLWHISFPGGVPQRIYNDLNRYEVVSLAKNSDTLVSVQVESRKNIYTVSPFEEPRRVTQITKGTERDDGALTFTPDGKIVFVSQNGGSRDLWMMDADGGNQKQLTFDELMEAMPAVSPDGRSIVFVSNPGIWRIGIDGSDRRQIAEEGMFPVYSRDGEWIFYTLPGERWTLWKMRPDGSEATRMTNHAGLLPKVSPDGKMIVYLTKPLRPSERSLNIIPVEGGEPLAVIPLPPPMTTFRWSPDGKAITYPMINNDIKQIVNHPLDGGAPQVVFETKTEDIGNFVWAPDGKRLYYVAGPESRNVVLFSLER